MSQLGPTNIRTALNTVTSATGTTPVLINGVSGSAEAGDITISLNDKVPLQFDGDVGFAIASSNILNVVGSGGTTVTASGDTLTIDSTAAVGVTSITGTAPLTMNGVSGSAQNGAVTAALTTPLLEIYGGTHQSTYTLGDTLYSSATNTLAKLSGNTDTIIKVLTQVGDGTNSSAPIWLPFQTAASSVYMFANLASSIPGYEQMILLSLYTAGAQGSVTQSVTTSPTLLQAFATNTGFPNINNIAPGIFTVHYHVQKASGGNNYFTFAEIYKRTSGGTETLLTTSENSVTTNSNTQLEITVAAFIDSVTPLDSTDLIVVKVYAQVVTSTVNISLYWDGTTSARVSLPTSATTTTLQGTAPLTVNGVSGSAQSGTLTVALSTPLALTYGGTNASLTASNGGIFYSTATAGAILSGTATAGQILRSGSSSAPSWSTATYPATTTINQLLYSSANNTIGGITASNNGVLISGTTGIPSWLAAGTTGQVLVATTSNPASWGTLSSIAVTSISGTANQVLANATSGSAQTGAVTVAFPATAGISIGSYQATTAPVGGILMPGNLLIGTTSPASTSTIYAVVPDATFGTATSFILSATSGANTFQLRGGVSATNSYAWLGSTQAGVSARALYLYGTPGVGINVVPLSALDVNGGVAIGSYAGVSVPPSNSLIISGAISIGSASPPAGAELYVSSSGNTESWVNAPAANLANRAWAKDGLAKWQLYIPASSDDLRLYDSTDRFYFQSGGNFGIGVNPVNKLDVNGGVAIGTYAGVNVAPSNGLIVSSSVCIGTNTVVSGAFLTIRGTTANNSGTSFGLYGDTTLNPTAGTGGLIGWYLNPKSSASGTWSGNSFGIYVDSGVYSGTVPTSIYSGYFINPSAGTNRIALYSDNLAIGYTSTTPPTNGIIISGKVGILNNAPLATALHIGNSSTASSNYLYIEATNAVDKGIAWVSSGAIRAYMILPGGNQNFLQITTGIQNLGIDLVNNRTMIGTGTALNQLDVNGAVAIGSYAGANTAPSNGMIVSGQVSLGQVSPNGFLTVNGSIGITGSANLPTNAGASIWLASGFTSPNVGRLYIGDGTGWIFRMAKRSASTDTDLIYFKDDGSLGVGVSPAYTLDLNTSGIARMNLLRTDAGAPGGSLTSHWLLCTTADALRWGVGLQTSETGSNAGSNLKIFTYDDTGSFLSSAISVTRSSNAVGINNITASTSTQLQIASTNSYNTYLTGTQTSVDGSSYQSSLYITSLHQPTNGSTLSSGIHIANSLSAPSTKTISFACGAYMAPTIAANVGTISAFVNLYLGQADSNSAGTISSAYNCYINQPLPSSSVNSYAISIQGGEVHFRSTATSDYTLTTANHILGVTNTAAARNINLPATAPDSGWTVIIKDESGGAAANNITINRNGRTIDGAAANLVINTNYGVYRIYSNGSNYFTW